MDNFKLIFFFAVTPFFLDLFYIMEQKNKTFFHIKKKKTPRHWKTNFEHYDLCNVFRLELDSNVP